MSSELQLDVHHLNWWWHHLVAYAPPYPLPAATVLQVLTVQHKKAKINDKNL